MGLHWIVKSFAKATAMTTSLQFISNSRADLWLSAPTSANAMSEPMVESLTQHVNEAFAKEPKLLIIRSEGKNFCGGFDLSDYESASHEQLITRFEKLEVLLQTIRHAPVVTVAIVQGAAFGAGADLVAACRFRLGMPGCRFKFPGSRFGVVLGTAHLAHIVGAQHAQRILLRNQLLDAKEAQAVGLLDTIIENESDADHWLCALEEDLSGLDNATLRQLLEKLTPDTRKADAQALKESVSRPGLHDRIARYIAASRISK